MLAMSDRIRITFDVPERVRRALNIRASRINKSVGHVIEWMTGQLLADDLALADKTIEEGAAVEGKRGRKPHP